MKRIAIGLMSGTSCDGVDVAILDTNGESKIEFLGGLTLPYDDDLRARLQEASQHDVSLVTLLRLEKEISQHHVAAIQMLLEKHPKLEGKVSALGFHGHTVRHVPGEGLTMQIGNPWLLAQQCGIPVVSDFRRCDMAARGARGPAGGHVPPGPLRQAAAADAGAQSRRGRQRHLVGRNDEIIAGDTGPGCGLIDEWAQTMADLPHDRDGQLALKGQVDREILEAALETPFFARPLPKSADRYDFDHVDVSGLSVEDGAATLCAVTAEAVFRAVQRLPGMPKSLWATGGGVHHPVIMRMLEERLGTIKSVRDRGLNPDTLEAECFAWLAVRHQEHLPLTVPETTGCEAAVSGGVTAKFG